MGDIERFIMDNLQILFVVAFILLPLIFSRRKAKKKRDTFQRPEKQAAEKKDLGESLERKVRKFFDEMVEEASPRPIASPPKERPFVMEAKTLPPKEIASVEEALPGMPATMGPSIQPGEPEKGPSLHRARAEHPAKEAPPEPMKPEDPWKIEPPSSTVMPSEQKADPMAQRKPSKRLLDPERKEDWETLMRLLAEKEGLPGRFSMGTLKGLSREDLRKAIVMKEILDHPVSMRM